MNTIRILFYTDYDEMTADSCSDFGLSELKRLLQFKTAPLCSIFGVEIESISRHSDLISGQSINGVNRLTEDRLREFDEIWIFGYRQTNTKEHPHNELDYEEVEALRQWMDRGGGLFFTGDHANPDPRITDV